MSERFYPPGSATDVDDAARQSTNPGRPGDEEPGEKPHFARHHHPQPRSRIARTKDPQAGWDERELRMMREY